MLNQLRATGLQVLVYLLVAAVPVAIASSLVVRRRIAHGSSRSQAVRVTILDAALLMSLVFIGIVTLLPSAFPLGGGPVVNLVPLRTISSALRNYDIWTSTPVRSLYLNILLFIPLGISVALRTKERPVRRACLTALAVSLTVEVVQYLFLPGRTVDVDDLILNTAGAALGATTALLLRRSRRRHQVLQDEP